MLVCPRFEAVRILDSMGWGPPYLLDTKWHVLTPHPSEEWWKSPQGIWKWVARTLVPPPLLHVLQDQRGALYPTQMPSFHLAASGSGSPIASTKALSGAYTFQGGGTTNHAIWSRVILFENETLNNAYVFISSFTGTAANVTDLNFELRNDNGSGTNASTTLHANTTANPSSNTGWLAFTGMSFAMTAGTLYWAICGDANGNATDFATLQYTFQNNSVIPRLGELNQDCGSVQDGLLANPTQAIQCANFILEFASGRTYGWGVTSDPASTNSTNRRGWRVDGFTGGLKVRGLLINDGTNLSQFEVHDDTSAPGSGILASGTIPLKTNSNSNLGMALTTPYAVTQAIPYRFVHSFSALSTGPNTFKLGATNSNTSVRKAKIGGSGCYWAEANGTTNWANDNLDATVHGGLVVDDLVAGGGLLRNPGMNGL